MFDAKAKNIIDRDNKLLSVAQDYWDDENDLEQRTAVLLWVPHTPETEHDHIPMDKKEARKLYEWLGEWLKEVEDDQE